jgi:23S rRNA pseudouridine1911/1915/1917 synthase
MLNRPLIPNEEKVEEISFTIKGRVEGLRLDAYLSKRFVEYSRAYLQKLIANKRVLIQGKPVKASAKIRAGQQVSIQLPKLEPLYLKPEKMPLEILYEDDSLAVLNKPSDLVIHPSRGHLSGTLVNGLLGYFEELSDYHEDVYRPGIVHRLDRYTSGVLLIAKNSQVHASLAKQFEDRQTKKEYLALVEGQMRFEEGTIALPLGVDPRNRERMAIRHGGKEAMTEYKVIARYPDWTLVHVFPKTGRTHQIRIHFKSQGHPIVADALYEAAPVLTVDMLYARLKGAQTPLEGLSPDLCLMERSALHAWRLTFSHPLTQETMTHVAPLPEDFQGTLETLEKLWPCSKVANILRLAKETSSSIQEKIHEKDTDGI